MPKTPRSATILRWIARIWTLPVFALLLMIVLSPDPHAVSGAEVPAEDWFLLSFWLLAVLGLALAWRRERTGALLTVAAMLLREPAWVVLKGDWTANFLIVWALVIPPAVLFLVAGIRQRRMVHGR